MIIRVFAIKARIKRSIKFIRVKHEEHQNLKLSCIWIWYSKMLYLYSKLKNLLNNIIIYLYKKNSIVKSRFLVDNVATKSLKFISI
jgi:hypothetical protein